MGNFNAILMQSNAKLYSKICYIDNSEQNLVMHFYKTVYLYPTSYKSTFDRFSENPFKPDFMTHSYFKIYSIVQFFNNCLLFAVKDCQPIIEDDKATFKLNLQNIYQCMVTKVVNKETVSKNLLRRNI